MHYTNILALALLFAGSAVGAPAPEPNNCPPEKTVTQTVTKTTTKTITKTAHPTTVKQSNTCGNGAAPYCCNTDNQGQYTTCSAMGLGSQCSQTTVCCNANNSIQVCLGNAIVTL